MIDILEQRLALLSLVQRHEERLVAQTGLDVLAFARVLDSAKDQHLLVGLVITDQGHAMIANVR